ncbi:MAG: hypothetical protein AAFZ15_06685 [Bacteroidota bacterium]
MKKKILKQGSKIEFYQLSQSEQQAIKGGRIGSGTLGGRVDITAALNSSG